MNRCHIDLWHAQTTKTTTNETQTIQDYLGGSRVQKSTCSHQRGSSLQLGLMREFQENAFVCCMYEARNARCSLHLGSMVATELAT